MERELPPFSLRGRVDLSDREFERLLGYPPEARPEGPTLDLMREARAWFEQQGRPWVTARVCALQSVDDGVIRLKSADSCSQIFSNQFITVRT